ncbi:MAG: EamA/RhaT family transporter, partial [Pseudomonadota bacterium]|nr:EamA/RhaT family transporter [Pseudomonadota bacterium]
MLTEQDSASRLRRRAILCVLGSSASFAVAAALVKAVSTTVPVLEIMLFRSLFAMIAILPLLPRAGGLDALRTRHKMGHVLRTIAGFAGMLGAFYG